MKKKMFRERHGYTAPIAIEKDPIAKTVKIEAVRATKTKKTKKKKSGK